MKPSQRGATMLELIIYIGIVGVILSAATLFAAEFIASQAKSAATIEAARNARFAAARIAAEVREATLINAGTSVFGTNPGTLSLETSVGGTDPTVFDVSGGVLRVTQGAGSAVALTSSKVTVTDFTVEDLSSGNKTKLVRIRVTATYTNPDQLVEFTAESTMETTARVHKDDGFAP